MNDDWVPMSLNEVAEVLDSQRRPINSDERAKRPGPVPYYGANGQAGWIDEALFDEPLVLLGEDAIDFGNPSARKAYVISGPSWVNNHAHVLRARRDVVLTDFLCHTLNHVDYTDFVAFGTRSKLTQSKMKQISVDIPPLPVQRRIVDLMAHLDNHLANLQTERDAAQRLLVALRDEQLEPGADWQVMRLLEVTTKVGSGATPRGGESSYVSSGISLIRSQNVYDYHFEWEGLARISDAQAQLLDGVTVRDHDVLINITGASVNRCCIVPSEALPARVNQHVAILRPDPDTVSSDFLLNSLRQSRVKAELDRMAGSGTTRQALTKSQLENVKISVPPVEDQASLVAPIQALHSVWEGCGQEAERLTLFRASLLSSLLSGRSSIPDAYDSLLPEVA